MEITNDPETIPENYISFVMTNIKGSFKKTLDNFYGLITWVEYGFRQCKQELGWTDYRFTNFQHIKSWWEIIFCVYTMISLNSPVLLALNQSYQVKTDLRLINSHIDFSNLKIILNY